MARRGNDAALKDVLMLLLKEEFVRDIARRVLRLTTQSMNFEDEEELNSWIWRSSHIQRNGARKIMRNECQWRH